MRDELYHFGTIGMHWGKRNYQNEDGSYKPGAEGRYYTPVGSSKRKGLFSKIREKKAAKEEENRKIEEAKAKEQMEQAKMRKTVSTRAGDISNQVSKMIVDDLIRWGEMQEYEIGLKNINEFENSVNKRIKEQIRDYGNNEKTKDYAIDKIGKSITFVIDGIPEYSDSAPLQIDYDPNSKKVTGMWYA